MSPFLATERDQLIAVTHKMESNSEQLDHAIQITEDTLQVGHGIGVELERQKTVMEGAIDKVSH
jgi:hypothetical protein